MRLSAPGWTPAIRTLYSTLITSRAGTFGTAVRMVDEDGQLLGPFPCLLHSPALGAAIAQVGTSLREDSCLPQDAREAAILSVAAHWRADYEWYAHATLARENSLVTPDDVDRIGRGELPHGQGLGVAVEVCHAMTRDHRVTAGVYERAIQAFGERAVVELVLLVGYYTQLAMLITTFETPSVAGIDYPWRELDG